MELSQLLDQTNVAVGVDVSDKDSLLEAVIDLIADRKEVNQRVSVWGDPTSSLDVTDIVPDNQVGLFMNFLKGRIPGVQILDNGPATRISIRGAPAPPNILVWRASLSLVPLYTE